MNKPAINQNRNTNGKHNLIVDNELVDNNINQPVVAPNQNQLLTFNLHLTTTHNLYHLIVKFIPHQIMNKISLT